MLTLSLPCPELVLPLIRIQPLFQHTPSGCSLPTMRSNISDSVGMNRDIQVDNPSFIGLQ
jgi:hypothetical protein